jgi:sorting nexin-13
LRSAEALREDLISGNSLHGHKDSSVCKDSDFARNDGLRFRKGNVGKNPGTSVSKTTANLYQDSSGSDPEQNDYSLSINSGNPKKPLSSETDDTSQFFEPDGYSLAPNDVSCNYFCKLFNLFLLLLSNVHQGWALPRYYINIYTRTMSCTENSLLLRLYIPGIFLELYSLFCVFLFT